MATGLAWTEVGGDTLAIEVSIYKGTGRLTLTGKLGDVMKESAQASYSYIRSRAAELSIDEDLYDKQDIHIHIPEVPFPRMVLGRYYHGHRPGFGSNRAKGAS